MKSDLKIIEVPSPGSDAIFTSPFIFSPRLIILFIPFPPLIFDLSKPTRIEEGMLNKFLESFSYAEKSINGYNEILDKLGRRDCQILI